MAIVYGSTQTEKNLLKTCPDFISKFGDIESSAVELKKKLCANRRDFFARLPEEIKKHKKALECLHQDRVKMEMFYEEKIWTARTRLKQIYLRRVSKPSAVNKHVKDIQLKELELQLLNNEPHAVFDRHNAEILNTLSFLMDVTNSQEYASAKGEQEVLKELKKLKNEFRVYCDMRVQLPNYLSYKGERNLGSAQMDFVVVGKTGVFVVEVKNLSSEYLKTHTGLNPHEQIDRAGMALFIYLNSYLPFKPDVSKILVPYQKNMKNDASYKFVSVVNLRQLNAHISNQPKCLSDTQTEDINLLLLRCV